MQTNLTELGEDLLRTWLQLSVILWDRQLISGGMTYNEAVVCNLLNHQQETAPEQPITATDLCEMTNIRKSQMNQLLSSLERRSLLERHRSESDRRRICLRLTEAGRETYLSAHKRAAALETGVVESLGIQDSLQLNQLLSNANAAVVALLPETLDRETEA